MQRFAGGRLSSSSSRSFFFCVRFLHTPIGGFREGDLPPSFGRPRSKGDKKSCVNLIDSQVVHRRRRRQRRPLLSPAVSLETEKERLEKWLQLNRVEKREEIACEERLDGPREQEVNSPRSHGQEQDRKRSPRDPPPSAPSQQLSQHTQGVLAAATHTTEVFSLIPVFGTVKAKEARAASENHTNKKNPAAARDGFATWPRERALEKHFGVIPSSTVFGSDLDRLERDYRREFHQRGIDLKARDNKSNNPPHPTSSSAGSTGTSLFSRFGGGRTGRRLTWAPSSSFDFIHASAGSSSCSKSKSNPTRREFGLGDAANGNLDAAFAAATAQQEREAAFARYAAAYSSNRFQEYSSGLSHLGKDFGKAKNAINELSPEVLHTAEDRPACENPHFSEPFCSPPESIADVFCTVEKDNIITSVAHHQEDEDEAEAAEDVLLGGNSRTSHLVIDARTDFRPVLRTLAPSEFTNTLPTSPNASAKPHVCVESKNVQDAGGSPLIYDAYTQRPFTPSLVELRGVDYWSQPEHRAQLDAELEHRAALFAEECLREGAMDSSVVEHSTQLTRREVLLYFQAHPINEMIQESFVRIREFAPRSGAAVVFWNPVQAAMRELDRHIDVEESEEGNALGRRPTTPFTNPWSSDQLPSSGRSSNINQSNRNCHEEAFTEPGLSGHGEGHPNHSDRHPDAPSEDQLVEQLHRDVDLPIQEARRLAQGLGLDLIRIGELHHHAADRRVIALCRVGDHREHLRAMLRFKLQKHGVRPPPTRACVEVPFRGGTHPHAIRFKSIGLAKHLLLGHTIRVNLTDFGTPREAVAVFQTILDEIYRQTTRLRAFHTAGQVQFTSQELFCFLHPSTGRSPKTRVTHPSPAELLATAGLHQRATERHVYFDQLRDTATARERLRYSQALAQGTAWAYDDPGLSLRAQRAMKVRLGYLPKGNKELYAARGDVDVPAPFRASHPTSIERWTYPNESNLAQARRGAAALGKRAQLPISEMHDSGETSDAPSVLDRFYYKVSGPALEVGEFKEALGLKGNRMRHPPLAPGFAQLGRTSRENSAQPRQTATK